MIIKTNRTKTLRFTCKDLRDNGYPSFEYSNKDFKYTKFYTSANSWYYCKFGFGSILKKNCKFKRKKVQIISRFIKNTNEQELVINLG